MTTFAYSHTARTFAEDLLATPIPTSWIAGHAHATATLTETVRYIGPRTCRTVRTVVVYSQALNRDGYTAHGQYFGAGMPLYTLAVDGSEFHVRAVDRASLRAALKRIFPSAKVSR